MTFARVLPALLLAFPIAGCAASPEASSGAALRDPFPKPVAGITVEWEDDHLSLVDVVEEFERATGLVVIVGDETRQRLETKRSSLYGVTAAERLDVPPERVHAFVEALLKMNQLVLVDVHDAEPRTIRLVSLETRERNGIRSEATYVPVEQLEAWRDHPAFLVTTQLELPGLDARTLANSLRTLQVDATTQSILPLGEHVLSITGPGPEVLEIVHMLRGAAR